MHGGCPRHRYGPSTVYLKRLTLKGFKSFADATTVELEPGVTVVVGPNGSGKSNIVDAVAWVLGAQGPSTVRSAKMDDVIFAGTPDRPASGRAEVTLTIDNSSGLLPIELSEVTIARTLFRSGDSEYAMNGVPCRLLDIQELLSDSGVGRTQHVIVSQGNLDAVLDARPEDRRAVIEEAAGVLKFRRRKERAERRLAATEGNLLRLTDLLREVRRQLKPLERQADAARRHQSVVDELAAVGLFVAGRELAALQVRHASTAAARAQVTADAATVRQELADHDAAVVRAEAELVPLGELDLGDHLVRAERLHEQARGLAAVLAERRRGLGRQRDTTIDADVVATLEAESARLSDELGALEAEAAALGPELDRLATDEVELAETRERFRADWGDEQLVLAPFGRAADLRGERSALVDGIERARAEATHLRSRLEVVSAKAERLRADAEEYQAAATDTERRRPEAEARVEETAAFRDAAESDVERANDELRSAEGEAHVWSARADALRLALADAHQAAGLDLLADLDGVLGTLADLVEIDQGWEAAVAAAIGPSLTAVVVSGRRDALAAVLERVAEAGQGTILATGSTSGPAVSGSPGLATAHGAEPVRRHVRARTPEADTLLDALVGEVVAVDGDWPAAADLALARPGMVVVTRTGDRFAPDGWRIGAGGSAATAAALDEADERAAAARALRSGAEARHEEAGEVFRRASAEATAAVQALTALQTEHSHAVSTTARLRDELVDLAAETVDWQERVGEIERRAETEEARLGALAGELAAAEQEEAGIQERARQGQLARAALEDLGAQVAARRSDLDRQVAGLAERRSYLEGRRRDVEARLARQQGERAQAQRRRRDIDARVAVIDRLVRVVDAHLGTLERRVAELRERRRHQTEATRAASERLDVARLARVEAERRLEVLREQGQRLDLEAQEIALRVEAAVAAVRSDHDVEPEVALAAGCPELPEGVSAPARRRELERELRLLGPVNPLALEEYAALCERHDFLDAQLDDVKGSRRELAKVIRAVDEEIVAVFAAAFADVAEHFTRLFQTLFPGGQGGLSLVDPSDPLNTGIEIDARPSGKNVKRLSLLSGGERSLTAMAYLFSVFRSRPSPFYLMDEVEAALDDVNLQRFLDLVDEFRGEAQLLIVSHQKRTMEVADTIYGVTMRPGASSKVVSERAEPIISLA